MDTLNSLSPDILDVSLVNKCLSSLGMNTITQEGQFQNKLNDLAMFHMDWLNDRTALEDRCAKLHADSNNYLNMMERTQIELDSSRREVTAISEKERQLRVKNKHLSSRLKAEEDEVKKLNLMMEHKQDHFNHELRKKERESLQLKERLSKKIMEKKTEKGTQQILNTVPRTAGGRRAQWGNDPREELYKQLVGEQEERNKELFVENDHLRHCLANLEAELINVLNDGDKNGSFIDEADLNPKIPPNINMPYPVVQDTVRTSIDDKIELIKEKHRRLANNKELEEELIQLKVTIESQQLTITEQRVAIEDCSCGEQRHDYSDIHDAELESRFQTLLQDREQIETERAEVQRERGELREEVDRERSELLQLENKIKDDHKKFREERTQLFETNLLSTPSITSIKRENVRRIESPLAEKPNPNLKEGYLYFSPAASTQPNIATTDEFQRELSRLDLSNLHGIILNENNLSQNDLNVTPNRTKDESQDLFVLRQQLVNQYMNTPV